jgi:CBS domain containing-hemolysin-like protein
MLLSPGRVHRLVESERHGAVALDRLAEHRHRLRAVSSLVAGSAFGAAAVWGAVLGDRIGGRLVTGSGLASGDGALWMDRAVSGTSGSLGAVVAVGAVYALSQALPRTVAATNPERVALDTSAVVLPLMHLVYPIAAILGGPWKWAVDVVGAERTMPPWAVSSEWRGSNLVEDAEREVAEESLLEAVSDFAEKIVREVMVPRTDVASLSDEATVAEAVKLIGETGYSRIPIYHDSVDDVRAVLYAKDLLGALVNGGGGGRAVDLARSPYFVPETKPVEELLVEMRTKNHIAIVADEYGGTAGLVTLEDLLEEIVGEISDEYDVEEALLVDLGNGRYQVDARLPVDDLNEKFDTEIEFDADSVGGLFTEIAGRIPVRGESVEIEGLRLIVTELDGTRIRQLHVEPAAATTEGVTHA